MWIYPSTTEYFSSSLSPEDLLGRLQHNTSNAVFEFRTEEFKGEIRADGFILRRLSWYTNVSNRPSIIGQVRPCSFSGSKVVIRQQLWLTGYWIGIFITLIISILLGSAFGSSSAGITGMVLGVAVATTVFAFALASILAPFWLEVRQSRRLLIRFLQLEEIPQA